MQATVRLRFTLEIWIQDIKALYGDFVFKVTYILFFKLLWNSRVIAKNG